MLRQHMSQPSDGPSPRAARSHSVASDGTSTSRFPSLSPPAVPTSPEPAYIAASAASQIVTNDLDPSLFDLTVEDNMMQSRENALVVPASLRLVNSFLDQLLYSILSVARSTRLPQLRPAVVEVLRPILAREAISGAEQELREYLGGEEEEGLMTSSNEHEHPADWDVDLAWKRARLRCMVYSSLGDMEEEDEEIYSAQDQLYGPAHDSGRHAQDSQMMSAAVAIFLTSVLEFIGEQTLMVAGQAAHQRLRSKIRENGASVDATGSNDTPGRLTVEELDTEKVALNPTFGRLWRTWRKRLRSPSISYSRPMSRESATARRPYHHRNGSSWTDSFDGIDRPSPPHEPSLSLTEVPEERLAANIALPMSENDVDEIEVPGVAEFGPYTRSDRLKRPGHIRRFRSLSVIPADPMSLSASDPSSTAPACNADQGSDPRQKRSMSQPPLPSSTSVSASPETANHSAFVTPLQSPSNIHGTTFNGEGDQHLVRAVEQRLVPERNIGRELAEVPEEQGSADEVSMGADPDHGSKPMARGIDADGYGEMNSSSASLPDHENGPIEEEVHAQPTTMAPVSKTTVPNSGAVKSIAKRPTSAVGQYPPVAESLTPTTEMRQLERPTDDQIYPSSAEKDGYPDPSTIGVARTSDVPVHAITSFNKGRLGRQSNTTNETEHDEYSRKPNNNVPLQGSLTDWSKTPVADSRSKRQASSTPTSPAVPSPSGASPALKNTPSLEPRHKTITHVPQRASSESGSSGLTPLREKPEGSNAQAASSTSPSQKNPDVEGVLSSGSRLNGHSTRREGTPSIFLHTRSPLSGNKVPQSHEPEVPLSPGRSTDRAGVQRVYSGAERSQDEPSPKSGKFGLASKGRRMIHQSVSETSQGPGSPTQASSSLYKEPEKPVRVSRTSEDARQGTTSENQPPVGGRPRDTKESFEELIKSGGTLQYTLTPASMRDPDSIAAPLDEHPLRPKQRSPLSSDVNGTGSPSSRKANNLAQPSKVISSPARASSTSKDGKSAVPVSRPPPTSKIRPGAPVARDARAEWSSTKEIADFLRSTGPPEEDAPSSPKGISSRSLSVPSLQGPSRSFGAAPRPVRDLPPKSTLAKQKPASPPRSGSSPLGPFRPKARLLARDAAVVRKTQTSDLVNFLREGPPGESSNSSLRNATASNNTLTPFRSGGSDQNSSPTTTARTNAMASRGSTTTTGHTDTLKSPHSVHSSFTSQTPLLAFTLPTTEPGPSTGRPPVQRKQRRVPDPYAIDTDDEDEGGLGASAVAVPPAKPRRQEESLMDFLRNVPPPPDQAALPSAFDGMPKPGSSKLLTKPDPSTAGAKKQSTFASAPPPQRNGTSSVGSSSRAPQLDTSFMNPGAGSVAGLGANQPRSARMDHGRTSELADFLKSSGPPPTPASADSAALATQPAKEEGGFSKMFRRKKTIS